MDVPPRLHRDRPTYVSSIVDRNRAERGNGLRLKDGYIVNGTGRGTRVKFIVKASDHHVAVLTQQFSVDEQGVKKAVQLAMKNNARIYLLGEQVNPAPGAPWLKTLRRVPSRRLLNHWASAICVGEPMMGFANDGYAPQDI